MPRAARPFFPTLATLCSPSTGILALLCAFGFGLRLWRALHADWYWDEGYLADVAWDLGRFQRPRSGALWFNGFLPLTTSWLAPLTAAPFTWLFSSPLLAVRVWASFCGAVTVAFTGLAGRRLGGRRLGLVAAGLLAVGGFPVALGGLALYHSLSAGLAMAALWLASPVPDGGWEAPDWAPLAMAGLSVVGCYWMWWLPLVMLLASAGRGRDEGWSRWGPRLAWAFGPAAAWLGLAFAIGGRDAWGMFLRLASYTKSGFHLPYLEHLALAFPMAVLGLAGLAALGRRHAWVLAAVGLGLADQIRQRGSLEGSPYVLLPLLPWFCVGLAAGLEALDRMAPRVRWLGWILALAVVGSANMTGIQILSVPTRAGEELAAFIDAQHCGQDSVVGIPSVDWRLRSACRPVEYCQAAAARGWSGLYLPAGLSPQTFAYDPSLEKARFLVVGRAHYDFLFTVTHLPLEALVAEYEGWPTVFENPNFRVYANPRFGYARHPDTRILLRGELYRAAASDAAALGRPDWADFARRRAAQAGWEP